MAPDSIVHVRPRAHQPHVAALALHFLARDGGHAERNGASERARAISEALSELSGGETPEDVCDTWWCAAGHGERE